MTAAPNQLLLAQGSPSLLSVVQAAHRIWIGEIESNLLPIIGGHSSFWERWTAVRYMADQFLAHYWRECSFIDELQSFLPLSLSERLSCQGERIGNLQRELDRVGRRRGTSRTVSVVARDLFDSLRSWCTEIEAAAAQVQRDVLRDEGQRVLEEFELYLSTHA